MSIFGILEIESVVQVNDKTRLGALKSFVTKGAPAIAKVEILPEVGGSYIEVTGTSLRDWYLDWVYTGVSRTVTVTLKITDATPVTPVVATFTKTLSVVIAADDMLFSSDNDLVALEPDILKWVPDGRSSWLNVHRSVQEKIVDWLNKSGIVGTDKLPLTKAAIIDVSEVKYWSRDWALALIYKGVQNASDDVFSEKAKHYFAESAKGSNRARLRLDLNASGTLTVSESINMTSRDLVRG